MEKRSAQITRKTGETDITMNFCLDGSGKAQLSTGIGFFDHMMDAFTRHGLFDMELKVDGDLHVDGHHTVEDTGIVLGQAIKEAVGDKKGIKRYGYFILPMDEALILCAVDLCGRPYFVMEGEPFTAPMVGDFDTELVREFFYSISYSAPHHRRNVQVLLQGAGHGNAEGRAHHGRPEHKRKSVNAQSHTI